MKHYLPNSLRALFLSLAVLLPLPMLAVEVEIDGINYDLIPKGKVATVIAKSSGKYSGEVVIPESVEHEGSAYSVTSIGAVAFNGCTGLTSVTIGNSVTSIGGSAFEGCSNLTSVHISDIAAWCNIDFGDDASNPLYYAHHLYLNGEEVKDLVIPNSVESIGEWAFYECTGLTSLTIGNSVTSIGSGAFWGCSDLTSVTIPNSVESIGINAFFNCSGLTSVHISDIAAWCNIDFATYGSNPLYYAHHLYLNGEEVKDLVIPNSVTSIGEYAFSGCSGLTSVTIPNSVTSIGNDAFSGCSGLTSVTIPNSVTSIGNGAFEGCSGLTSIVVEDGNPVYDSRNNCNAIIETATNTLHSGCKTTIIPNSVTSIGYAAFYECSGLTSVTIPNSVLSIGLGAFWGCSGLTSITIPNSVTSIEQSAFRDCSGLTSVSIGNSVKSIGAGAFEGCSGLTSVTIPNSVKSIGMAAFSCCSGLTSVTIGNSVESIGGWAFAYCHELLDVYCYAEKVPSTDNYAFYSSNYKNATLHVPAASIDNYKASYPWSRFGKIVALTE